MSFLFADEVEKFIYALPEVADEEVMHKLDALLKKCIDHIDDEEESLFNSLFLKAIRAHFRPNDEIHEHIYLHQYEIPQIILFDILTNQLPFVTCSHAIVNATIGDMLFNATSAVIIDIGIGRGIQMVRLIDALSGKTKLKELTIIGIEPFQMAMDHATQLIKAKTASFNIIFTPLVAFVEHLRYENFKQVLPSAYEGLIINASLVLHHLQSRQERVTFFNLISSLEPDAVILTEPYSDHMTSDWKQRVINAYIHYGSVFSMVDSLAIGIREKNGLKMFFGREIEDVVGNPESQRFERHERGENWVAYLKESNFIPMGNIAVPNGTEQYKMVFHHDEQGFLTMKHKNIDVLSIIGGTKK